MRKTILSLTAFIAILIFLCIAYYGKVINKLPHGVHEWGQADRLALAVKFYDNGMNLFKPATYNQNSINGIVGVEFPIQAYTAAALGHLFGRGSISACFRFINIIITCIGLSFLFFTCFRTTKNFVLSLIPPLLIFSSPAFIDYGGNYLPDPASVSIAFVAFYFMLNYVKEARRKDFYITVALLTLATLIKTSTGLYLVGFVGYVCLAEIRKAKHTTRDKIGMLAVVLLAFGIVFGYNRYNNYLNEHYQSSLFFARMAPFESMKEVERYIKVDFQTHLPSYFSIPTYVLLFAISAAGIALLSKSAQGKKYLTLAGIFLLGAFSMATLLGKQIGPHDYYMLPILFPLFGYMLSISINVIASNTAGMDSKHALQAAAFVVVLFTFFFTDYYLARRRSPQNLPYARNFWMQDGAKAMDKFGIPKNATILALQEEAPNLTSVYMDRNGLTFPWYNWDRANAAPVEQLMRERKVRFVVSETHFIKESVANHPDIFKNFRVVGEEGQITALELIN